MATPEESLTPLQRVEERFREAAEAEGGKVVFFGLQPGRREITVMLELDEDLFLDDEGREFKDKFEEIERGFHTEKKEERMVEAVRDLSELEEKLADPGEGIL